MELFSHQNANNSEEKKDDAIRSIRAGVSFLNEILKTTLGPKSSLKLLQGKNVAVSNDGAFILKNLLIDNAAARIIASSSISQDTDEGDGTTSIAVLATLLLEEAYKSTVHPIKLIRGFSMALEKVLGHLAKKRFVPRQEDILNLIKTTLNSKILSTNLKLFVEMCVSAVEKVENIGNVNIIQMEGDLGESYLIDGFILDKTLLLGDSAINDDNVINSNITKENYEGKDAANDIPESGGSIADGAPAFIDNPRILVANTSLDYDKIKIMSSKINVESIGELIEIEKAEKEKMIRKVKGITGIPYDVFINRQIIYDYPCQLLRSRGVSVIEHADFKGIESLNRILGGDIISTFDQLRDSNLGHCKRVCTVEIKGKKMVKFEGVKSGAVTIILCGGSKEILEEAERSIHDALCVLKRIKESPYCVYGGGSIEMFLATELSKFAMEVKTKESEGIECFSKALQQIPKILSDNSGFDGDETKNALKSSHYYRKFTQGVDVETGKGCCMKEKGIIEGYEMKRRVLTAACETAQCILKCDGLVRAAPRERTRH